MTDRKRAAAKPLRALCTASGNYQGEASTEVLLHVIIKRRCTIRISVDQHTAVHHKEMNESAKSSVVSIVVRGCQPLAAVAPFCLCLTASAHDRKRKKAPCQVAALEFAQIVRMASCLGPCACILKNSTL
jgi:hypothetical protein